MTLYTKRQALAVICFAAWAPACCAAAPPAPVMDSGALMQHTQQSHQAIAVQREHAPLSPIEPPLALPKGVTVRVASFKFMGANLLKPEQLQAATRVFAHRDLTSSDLDNLCSAVIDAYRQAGWVVRVYVPQQPPNAESLTLRVLETVPPPSPK